MRLVRPCTASLGSALLLWLTLGCCARAAAQEAFVAGSAGAAVGSGTSGSFSVSAGYLMSRRFGLEVEFSVAPDIERDGPSILTIQRLPNVTGLIAPTIFPGFQIDRSARLYSFHTDAVVPLIEQGRIRLSSVAGGGVATLSQRVHLQADGFDLPAFPGIPGFGGPSRGRISIPPVDITRHESETALSLQVGGTVDVSLNTHASVGADIRYQHVFLADQPLDLARIAGRFRWRF
jgi:hypothetical protein